MSRHLPDPSQHPAVAGIQWTWSAYLATSWTWCIGMFLPVLLVRDFGLWGWLVFAIPNVLGAALVGRWNYQLAEGQSLLDKHRHAMAWFSIVTVAFHVFFIAWLVERLMGHWAILAFMLAVVVFTIFIKLGKAGLGAWIALFFSAITAGVYFSTMGMDHPPALRIDLGQAADLVSLAPAIVLGFMLCPHMDLTFHRARAAMTPAQARPTFIAGFFGFFFLMILFTLFYAGALRPTVDGNQNLLLPAAAALAIALHMCVQGGLTTALHVSEIIRRASPRHMVRSMMLFGAAMVLMLLLGRAIVPGSHLLGYDPGEVVYRIFIGFYGLVFPAYAWAAWTWRRQPQLSLAAWLLPILVALPMFAAGFLTHRPLWIVPGVALVLVIPWLMLPRQKPAS